MLIGPETTLKDSQSHQNRSTRGRWDFYSRHRVEIEQLIVPPAPGGRLCVLGAGNCNDLDLQWAVRIFREVHLVDIDSAALQAGVERQEVKDHERIICHAPVDLTAIAQTASSWRHKPPTSEEIERAIREVENPPATDREKDVDQKRDGSLFSPSQSAIHNPQSAIAALPPSGFDVVLSPCVLSQLLLSVRDVITAEHPAWPRFRAAIRRRHLAQMAGLLSPGGRGVLIVDLVSSGTLPQIDRAREHEVPGIMDSSIRDRKCFRGLEPAELAAVLRRDPALAAQIAGIQITAPWLWHLAFAKAFVVYGMVFVRGG